MTQVDEPATPSSRWSALLLPDRVRPAFVTAIVALAMLVATWPIRPRSTAVGRDPAYLIGLGMAHRRGLAFGHDVIFNYGPLGFLAGGMTDHWNGVLAWILQALVQGAIVLLVLVQLRKLVSLPVAAVVGTAMLLLIHPDPAEVNLGGQLALLTVLWAVWRLVSRREVPWGRWSSIGPAVVAALALLVKVDTGLVVLLIAGLTVGVGASSSGGARAAARAVGLYLAVAVATVVGAFAIVEGGVTHFGSWLRGAYEVSSGFSGALGLSRTVGIAAWEHLAVVVGLAVFLRVVTRLPLGGRSQVAGVAALVALATYLTFRQGFVRYDVFHVRQFLAVAILMPLGLAGVATLRQIGALMAIALVGFVPGQKPSPSVLKVPFESADAALDTTLDVLVPSRAQAVIDGRRAGVTAAYDLPDSMLRRIGDHSVAIVPSELEVAFGYDLAGWAPLPIFQDYQAYTEWLDDRNAARLSGDDAPRFVLRTLDRPLVANAPPVPIKRVDTQFARFQPPGEHLAILCHDATVASTRRYELLERVPDRCSEPATEPWQPATTGTDVEVPTPRRGELIVARFRGVAGSFVERMRTTLYRGSEVYIGVKGGWFRYVPGTQGSWHVMSGGGCASDLLDTTGGDIEQLALSDHQGPGGDASDYEVQFARITVDC